MKNLILIINDNNKKILNINNNINFGNQVGFCISVPNIIRV